MTRAPVEPRLHVVAAVLRDARSRVLMTRRTQGRDLAGLWEFPGGKVEPGETPRQALARELDEELGIRIGESSPLISVPHAYPHRRIVLDVHVVAGWQGKARGRERQALAWTPQDRLAAYPTPAADVPVIAALLQPDRYPITPDAAPAELLAGIDAALRQGIRRLQLRAPGLPRGILREVAVQAASRCRAAGAQLLVNGDIALARELGIGVHLPAALLRELRERPLPPETPVAASCHDGDELACAQALGCDFAVLGPVLATASHPGAAPIGWEGFALLRERVSLPIYALGGLRPEDVARARLHGAQGVAAIRGLWPSATRS